MSETWKAVADWPNYEASSFGRIRRLSTQRVLSPSTSRQGYLRVTLHGKSVAVAKLVALAFLGPRPNGLQINHIDGIKANNRPENLEYCTSSENNKHAFRLGLNKGGKDHGLNRHPEARLYGSKQHLARFTEDQVKTIRREYATGTTSYIKLAKRFNVHRDTIMQMVTGETWPHVSEGLPHVSRRKKWQPKTQRQRAESLGRVSAVELARLIGELQP